MPSPKRVEKMALRVGRKMVKIFNSCTWGNDPNGKCTCPSRLAKLILAERREAWDEGRAAGFEEGLDGDAPKNPYSSKP